MTADYITTAYKIGAGSLDSLKDYAGMRIALITDVAVFQTLGLDNRLKRDIWPGAEYNLVLDMNHEPCTDDFDEAIERVAELQPEVIVAIGGGSVLDAAKALWLFYEHPDYGWEQAFAAYQVEPFTGKAQMVAVPTTSGTGSETTGCAVVKDSIKNKRMILSPHIVPTTAILDFDLLGSLPPNVIAYSGADALAHALEAAVCIFASPMVQQVCAQAAVILINNLAASYRGDMEARTLVHIASAMAGMGIGNACTGMAHGMDYAGGDFGLPHGMMTGMLLPYTMRYLQPQPVYGQVASQLGIPADRLPARIFKLYKQIGMPLTLAQAGVPEDEYLKKISGYILRAKADSNIEYCPANPTDKQLGDLFTEFYYGIEEGNI